MSTITADKILDVLPDGETYCLTFPNKDGKPTVSKFFADKALFWRTLTTIGTRDVWFCPCGFEPATAKRKNEHVTVLRAFRLDLDPGPGYYASKEEMLAALLIVLSMLHLPPPTHIVDSGNGLHIYWAMNAAIPANKWEVLAKRLACAIAVADPRLAKDTTRWTDPNGLLRPPGTWNCKDPTNPKPVQLLRASAPLDAVKLISAIQGLAQPVVSFAAQGKLSSTGPRLQKTNLLGLDNPSPGGSVRYLYEHCRVWNDQLDRIERGGDWQYNAGRWEWAYVMAFCHDAEEWLQAFKEDVSDPLDTIDVKAHPFHEMVAAQVEQYRAKGYSSPHTCAHLISKSLDASGNPYRDDSMCRSCPIYRAARGKNTNSPVNLQFVAPTSVTAPVISTPFPPPNGVKCRFPPPGFLNVCDMVNPQPTHAGYWRLMSGELVYMLGEVDETEDGSLADDAPRRGSTKKKLEAGEIITLCNHVFWPLTKFMGRGEGMTTYAIWHGHAVDPAGWFSTCDIPSWAALSKFEVHKMLAKAGHFGDVVLTNKAAEFKMRQFCEMTNKALMGDTPTRQQTPGWGDDGSFTVGNMRITADGYAYSMGALNTRPGFNDLFIPVGDPHKQVAATKLLMEVLPVPFKVALLAQFASPLLQFAGISEKNGIINIIGTSNFGKTKALSLISSVWQRPSMASPNATKNGLETVLVHQGNLPLITEELAQIKRPEDRSGEEAAATLRMFIEGKTKDRQTADGSLRPEGHWSLIVTASSNESVHGFVPDSAPPDVVSGFRRRVAEMILPDYGPGVMALSAPGAERPPLRVTAEIGGQQVEIEVPQDVERHPLSADIFKRIEKALAANRGFLGPAFARYVQNNEQYVRDGIARYLAQGEQRARARGLKEHGFLVAMWACMMQTYEILMALGWVKPDMRMFDKTWEKLVVESEARARGMAGDLPRWIESFWVLTHRDPWSVATFDEDANGKLTPVASLMNEVARPPGIRLHRHTFDEWTKVLLPTAVLKDKCQRSFPPRDYDEVVRQLVGKRYMESKKVLVADFTNPTGVPVATNPIYATRTECHVLWMKFDQLEQCTKLTPRVGTAP